MSNKVEATYHGRTEFFGRERPGTTLLCGYDGGHDEKPVCGKPAIMHVWPGKPPKERLEGTCFACNDHVGVLYSRAWDWHPIGGACGIPGARWINGSSQGIGLCRHDIDDGTLTTALANAEGQQLVQDILTRKQAL